MIHEVYYRTVKVGEIPDEFIARKIRANSNSHFGFGLGDIR